MLYKPRQHQNASTADFKHVRAIDGLGALLGNEASPVEAAEIITIAYEDFLLSDSGVTTSEFDGGNKIMAFWTLYLCEAIRTFGTESERESMIALLVEITRRPDVRTNEQSLKTHIDGGVYWRDLPCWSRQFADYGLLYDHPLDFGPDESDDYFAQAPYLLNATTFAAVLLSRGEITSGLPRQVNLFLEYGLERRDIGHHRLQGQEWRVLLPCAATWLLIAGARIRRLCLGVEVDNSESRYVTSDRYGGRAWCLQRWGDWKMQLRRMSERPDVDENCRDYAARAETRMAKLELEYRPGE